MNGALTTKTQDFVVRFASGVTQQTVHIGKKLQAVRGILLNGYAAAGLDGTTPIAHVLRIAESSCQQLQSFALPGYAFTLCPQYLVAGVGTYAVEFDKPRVVASQAVPMLQQLTLTISTATGAAPVYTELVMSFSIVYEDDRMDLLDPAILETGHFMLNHNIDQNTEAERNVAIAASRAAIFSRLNGK